MKQTPQFNGNQTSISADIGPDDPWNINSGIFPLTWLTTISREMSCALITILKEPGPLVEQEWKSKNNIWFKIRDIF